MVAAAQAVAAEALGGLVAEGRTLLLAQCLGELLQPEGPARMIAALAELPPGLTCQEASRSVRRPGQGRPASPWRRQTGRRCWKTWAASSVRGPGKRPAPRRIGPVHLVGHRATLAATRACDPPAGDMTKKRKKLTPSQVGFRIIL
jgi:hypothetical protein